MEADPEVGVLVVSEHTLLREGARACFATSRYKIRHEVSTIGKAVELGDDHCNLIFIGSWLEKEMIEPLKLLRAKYQRSRIVLYAERIRLPFDLLFETFGTSLDGCVMSDSSTEVLHQSLNLIMMGQHIFPFNLMLNAFPGEAGPGRGLPLNGQPFSERERQVLNFLREGRSNKFVARELHLSEATVKVHIKTLLKKISCANRTQAAIWVTKHGTMWTDESYREPQDAEIQAPALTGSVSRD